MNGPQAHGREPASAADTPTSHTVTDGSRVLAAGARGEADIKHLLKRLRLTPVTIVLSMVTLTAILVGVVWVTHLPSYLRTTQVNWFFYVAAFVVAYGQYVGFATSLRGASTTRLPWGQTIELEVAESLTQMATPEGFGSLALSLRYLTTKGLAAAEAATAVSLSAFVTTTSGAIVIPIAGIAAAQAINVDQLKKDIPSSNWLLIVIILAVAAAVTVLVKAPKARQKVKEWGIQAKTYGDTIIHHPTRGLVIAGGELLTIVCQAACLMLLLAALHLHGNVAAVLVITQLAGTASNIVPVPGGLGAPEALLVAGLTAMGLHQTDAIVAGLSYRMATYWLPPLPGTALLFNMIARKRI